MSELPECPRCSLLIVGASTPQGGAARKGRAFPDRSTGYCDNCHIGLTKIRGVWAPTPTGGRS